jgi:hypothetical protein
MRVLPWVFACTGQTFPFDWVPVLCVSVLGLTLAMLFYYRERVHERKLRKTVELSVRLAIEATIEHEREIEGYRLEHRRYADSLKRGASDHGIALSRRFKSSSALDNAIHELVELELGQLPL